MVAIPMRESPVPQAFTGLPRRSTVLRAGDGRCMADRPPTPPLRRIEELKVGTMFITRLTRIMGRVLGRTPGAASWHGIEVELSYRGSTRLRIVKKLDPRVLVEVLA
jgi:hypothetical protein